jgi:hypothetical protein
MDKVLKKKIQNIYYLINKLNSKYGSLLSYFMYDKINPTLVTLRTMSSIDEVINTINNLRTIENDLRFFFLDLIENHIHKMSGNDLHKLFSNYFKMIKGPKSTFYKMIRFDKNQPIDKSSKLRLTGVYANLTNNLKQNIYDLHNEGEKVYNQISQFQSLISRKGRGIEEEEDDDIYGGLKDIPRKYL